MIAEFIICGIISLIANISLCLGLADHASQNPGGFIDRLPMPGTAYLTWIILFLASIGAWELLF
jgi:hypothetical protein